jgi:2'-5' RNA ligase
MIHFLALRLADEPRDRLAMIAERLQAWQLPAAWVHPEDYHLTLAYIGELDDDEVRVLPHVIGDVAGSLRRPELRFSGLGAQGGRAEPRVVFAALDLPARRQFSPHVTLCRPRTSAARELAAASGGHDWPGMFAANGLADWGACPTTDLVLYQSAGQQQIRYRALARWPLVAA